MASYRHLYLENADICSRDNGETKELDLGAGSAIFALENAASYKHDKKYRDRYKKCQVLVRAKAGFGLMAYIEKLNLRQDTRTGQEKCIDYVQFGRDDVIPFITVYKSEKICGEQYGLSYDDPGGSLLIWLTLGPSRPSSYRESLNVAKLSIVVTAYQKDDSKAKLTSSFRACNEGRRWVRKEYFCDGRTNCALDRDPADESVESCPGQAGDQTTSGPTGDGDIHPPLNLISITLVLVSCVVLLVLIFLLLLRVKRSGGCCWGSQDRRSLCELPEHGPAGLHQLARRGGREPGDRVDNLYLPLQHPPSQGPGEVTGSAVAVVAPAYGTTQVESSLVRRTTPEQEPPPAYHDLFPPDFVFEDKHEVTVDAGSGPAAIASTSIISQKEEETPGGFASGGEASGGVRVVSTAGDGDADRIAVSEDQTELL